MIMLTKSKYFAQNSETSQVWSSFVIIFYLYLSLDAIYLFSLLKPVVLLHNFK